MPPSGCVGHLQEEGRATQVRRGWLRRFGAAALLTVALATAVPGVAAAGTDPTSPRCGRDESGAPKRCVGPVTDESGGGGSTLTIVVSIVVGLAVAGVAFVLVRRQLAPPPEQGDAS